MPTPTGQPVLPITRHAPGRAAPLPEPVPQAVREPVADVVVPGEAHVPERVLVADEGEPDMTELTVDDDPETMAARAAAWRACSLGQRQIAHRLSADAETITVAAQAEANAIIEAARQRAGRLTAESKSRAKRADGLEDGARTLDATAGRQQRADEADDAAAALEAELDGLPAVIAGAEAELARLRAEQAGAGTDLQAGIDDRDRDAQDEARRVLAAVAAELTAAERDRETARARRYELQRTDSPLERARAGQNRNVVAEGLDYALAAADPAGPAAGRVAVRQEAARRAQADAQPAGPRRVTMDDVRARRVTLADVRGR